MAFQSYTQLSAILPSILSNPQLADACCPGQSARGADPSSRLGLPAPEVAHKTLEGWGPFAAWRLHLGSSWRCQVQLGQKPSWSTKQSSHQEARPPSGALDESQQLPVKTSVRPRFWERDMTHAKLAGGPRVAAETQAPLSGMRRTGLYSPSRTSNLPVRG